jgi:xanthine dehydrogenase molybdenum-binding subunit
VNNLNDELKVVGKSLPRLDAQSKVTGAAKYAGDLWQYGMLHCKLLRSPYGHARILNIDTSKAEKLDGVKAILTHKDVPQTLFGDDHSNDANILPDRVRFVGDEVVAVAAITEEIAERALELIDVEYEQLSVSLTLDDALKPEAPLIPPPERSSTNLLQGRGQIPNLDWGDFGKGLEEADHIFEDECTTKVIQHMNMETKACLASWDQGKLTVWLSTQRPFAARRDAAKALSMPENMIRVIVPYVGGGFGSKGEATRFVAVTALLSRKTGKPVRLVLTREEDMLNRTRPAIDMQVKMGVKQDGIFTAMSSKVQQNGGAYNCLGTLSSSAPLNNLFKCSNRKFEGRSVYTNRPPSGQLRGVGSPPMVFALTQLADQVAEELGFTNPIEFMKKTYRGIDDGFDSFNQILNCSSCGLEECLEKGAKSIGWTENWKGWKTPVQIRGQKRVGIGMAINNHDSGVAFMVSGAVLEVNMDGTANFFTPVTEIGNGAMTTQTQVVSEASGIPIEDIYTIFADTDVTPVDPFGQVGSSTAHIRSIAAKLAGEDARQQMFEGAAGLLNVAPDDLDIKESVIFVKTDPQKSITVKDLMGKVEFGIMPPVIGRGRVRCPSQPQKAFNFGAHFALVEVDTGSGEIKVLKYVAAHDVGKALNPSVVESQIIGGVVMGLSSTLNEEMVFNKDGKPLNLNFTDYKIFTQADCPEIIPIIVEPYDPISAYGAKGFAEGPIIGVSGCIANAIYNAIGIRFKELPITPEKVLKALAQ